MAIGTGRGKIIFFGEHFVVYGCKAIGFGLEKKIIVEVKKTAQPEIGFSADKNCKRAVNFFKSLVKKQNFTINIKSSEIPPASGLGSSAAFNVAAIRALSEEFGLGLENMQINNLAFEAEKIFHGTPSGIDNILATFGGAAVFQKKTGNNLIKPLRIKTPLHLVMADSGITGQTLIMVNKVRALKEKNEKIFSNILATEAMIVNLAVQAVKKGDLQKLGSLMNINHGLLNAIGVSHIECEKIISICRENGALGAKISGGGGGGFCAALMENKKSALALAKILKKQCRCFYALIPSV